MIRHFLLIGLLVILTSLPTTKLQAADESSNILSLKINPPIVQLITKPGQPISYTIRIQNTGTQAEQVRVDRLKFSAEGEDGNPTLAEPDPTDDFMEWFTVSETSLKLAVNEERLVKVVIHPHSSAVGGYYYALSFKRDIRTQKQEESGSKSIITGGVATLILLTVDAPNVTRSLELVDFGTTRRVYEYLPVELSVRLKNTGDVHLVPDGSIFIDSKGADTATIDFNPASGNVLPNSNRTFTLAWNDGFPVRQPKQVDDKVVTDKNGRAVQELKWDLTQVPKFRIGKYVAKVVVVYHDGVRDVPLRGEVSFWVLPWKLLLIGLLIVWFFLLGLKGAVLARFGRRRSRRR